MRAPTLFPFSSSPASQVQFIINYQIEPIEMELIFLYVTACAIIFVRCEFNYNSLAPFYDLHRNQIYTGDWKRENTADTERVEDADEEVKFEIDAEEELKGRRKDFSQVFDQIKSIYDRCKTKVNKRLKNLIKNKVKSRLSELKVYISSVYHCVKVFSFRSLDEMSQGDFIKITDYAYFIKDGTNATEDSFSGRTAAAARSSSLREFAAKVLPRDWTALAADWLENLMRTHSLKFHLDQSLDSQGRSRRRDHRVFAMMVMGFMIMASILIPMGFQFLTVLGGKSLLLAKMALIMSAINGLKKIATSNVGYGFYHTGSDGHHHEHLHHGFHEKHYHVNPPNYNNLQGYN